MGSSGILILGTGSGCGKTVLATGLASTLQEEGFKCGAIKPVCLGERLSSDRELAFLSSISKTPVTYPVQYLEKPGALSAFGWAEAVRVARSSAYGPAVVELPGSCATPLTFSNGACKDVADLALEIKWPCLVVAAAAPDAGEKLLLNAVYLLWRGLRVTALAVVETVNESGWSEHRFAQAALALKERTGAAYLGCLRYSPSISVQKVNQGNLIKTTSAGVDLLPVIKALDLRVEIQ